MARNVHVYLFRTSVLNFMHTYIYYTVYIVEKVAVESFFEISSQIDKCFLGNFNLRRWLYSIDLFLFISP